MKSQKTIMKKLLTQGLDASEKLELSEDRPMKQLLSDQWEEKADRHLLDQIDSAEMWENIIDICWEKKGKSLVEVDKRTHLIRMISALSAVVALFLVGAWIVNVIGGSYITVKAPLNEKLAWTLPDNSKVWINAGSTLYYNKNFAKDRHMQLDGEALFDVVKVPESPFRVNFNGACVEVKGTVFTINAEKRKAEVVLFSGKVAFTAPEQNMPIEMKPSERIVYDAATQTVSLTHVDAMEYDWRTTEYRFVDKPLGELINFIKRTYKVNIVLADKEYEELKFLGNIRRDESLKNVLDKIGFTFDLKFKKIGEDIILY